MKQRHHSYHYWNLLLFSKIFYFREFWQISFSGYIKVDGVSSVFCFIWGWEEPTWGLPFQFHGVFYVMISMKGP